MIINMEEKDKWIKNLRDRMEDYSEPLPDGLWEQLEEELDTPKVVPMRTRWQTVAAVAVLVLLSSLTVWFWQSPSAAYLEQQSAQLEMARPADEVPSASVRTDEVLTRSEVPSSVSAIVRSNRKSLSSPRAVTPLPDPDVVPDVEIQSEKEIEETTPDEQRVAPSASGKAGNAVRQKSSYAYAMSATPGRRERNWSVGLSTGNGTFSSSTSMDGYLPMPGAARAPMMAGSVSNDIPTRGDIDKVVQFANLAEGERGTSDVKYRMPVTFGLSFRIGMARGWSVETGLTYTQLSSEVRSGTAQNNYSWEDKLHYVGIPLKVHRTLWENKRLEAYASGGGMVEKCVSGKQTVMWNTTSKVVADAEPEETDIKVKPLQWSLSAAAGLQLKLTDKLGVYAEPGVVYYFDDGSPVKTIRKEHPFNFNVQLGLRMSLSK